MPHCRALGRAALIVAVTATIVLPVQPAEAHERKEVAGLMVIFGAEPEPAFSDNPQFLRWRFRSLESEEPFAAIVEGSVIVRHGGREYGPFDLRGSRANPGQYQTFHLFTAPGEYETVLTFKKEGSEEVYGVDFTLRIADRAVFEIPGGGQEGDATAVREVLAAYTAAAMARDLDAMGELVTDDLLIFEGPGVDRGWAEYRDHHLGPELERFEEFEYAYEDVAVEVSGDMAWAELRYRLHIRMGEREIDAAGVGTAVLVRGEDGRWRMRHLHTTPERRPEG